MPIQVHKLPFDSFYFEETLKRSHNSKSKHGCIVIWPGGMIFMVNGSRKDKGFHAEMNAVHLIPRKHAKSAILYVWRVRTNGDLALSKPCKRCERIIKRRGIRNVYYSTEDQDFEKLEI